ncbi:MAG TPA: FAD-binding protein [Saprospiraceae bacterium]|nr:FAD-binding protein [Saprospiraceae bacterium]
MIPRLLEISRTRYTWYNATNNIICEPLRFFYPRNEKDISEIVKEAESKHLRVRAVGSGHSFSEVAKCNDFLMDMKYLRDVAKYESPWVRAGLHTNHYVMADAGITIRRLNRLLDSMGLALENMGAVDFQTVSGALMTGTHGTGIKRPAFPDMVRSLRLVGTGGNLIQIEPANGITDPVYHYANSDIELIQDDDIFYATVLSFGGMGIVYQLVFEVRESYFIKERRYLIPWSQLKIEMQNGTFMQMVKDNDFVALRINPYVVKGDHLASVVVQNVLPGGSQSGGRNFLNGFLGTLEPIIENTVKLANRKPKNTAKRIQLLLKFSKVINYTDKNYKVLYQFGSAALRYGISSEFAFAADTNKVVEVFDKIFANTEYNSSNFDVYQPSHIAMRFVMPSKALLSSAYDRDTMYIDIPTLNTTIGDFELLDSYQTIMMDMGGIPHWGKVNSKLYLNTQFIKDHYPKWQTWVKVRNQMDPMNTFMSDFIIKMGLA